MREKLTKKQKDKLIKEFGHIPTKEEIFAKIRTSQEKMMAALKGAWDTAPDDPKIRKQLVEVVEKASKLRNKIYNDILQDKSMTGKNKK